MTNPTDTGAPAASSAQCWPKRRQCLHALAALLLMGVLPPFVVAGSFDDFFSAVKRDDADTVRALLQRGLEPNMIEPERGDTGLILAVRENAMRVFQVLLNAREIKLEVKAANGDTALMLAAYSNNLPAFDALLAKGVEVNQTGWTALHYAAAAGNNLMVQRLLEQHAYIDAESPNKTTPIMMAARAGHILTVKLLLDEGADVTLKNEQGKTAIDLAAMHNQRDIVEGLQYRLKKAGKL